MKLEELAVSVLDAVEATGVPFMAVGAIAAGAYGVPRSTRDVDLLVALHTGGGIRAVMTRMHNSTPSHGDGGRLGPHFHSLI